MQILTALLHGLGRTFAAAMRVDALYLIGRYRNIGRYARSLD